MKYALAIIGAILAIAVGFFVGRSQRAVMPEQKQEQVDIYYLRADGLYKTSSAKEGEERLLEGEFRNVLAAQDKLVVASESAFLVYNLLTNQASAIEPVTPQVNYFGYAVSTDGLRVAYVKNIQLGDIGFKNELWLWDVGSGEKKKLFQEPELGADPEGVYYTLVTNGWLDDKRLLVGRAYEGASFCPFTVGTDTKLPQQCSSYGFEQIGLSDRILATDNGVAYGVKRIVFPEGGLQRDQTGLYQLVNDQKQFISADIASSLVKSGDVLYLTKLVDETNFSPIQSDLFSFNLKDESTKRLTHDATSVDTKENLRLSNKGRFLSWDSKQISTDETKVWVYDLKLNQYYPLSEGTWSAVVIEH